MFKRAVLKKFVLAIVISFVHAAGEMFAVLIFHPITPFPFRQQETADQI